MVIDNPPFSILSQICRFYQEHNIRYFLFAPALTLFSIAAGECNYVASSTTIIYDNGALVRTGFVTNLGAYKIETCPDLYQIVDKINAENIAETSAELPGYTYPDCVISAAPIAKTAKWEALQILPEDAVFVRALDEQRKFGKAIFGGGFLLSEKAAAEKAAAEKKTEHVWKLSEREREIAANLGKH